MTASTIISGIIAFLQAIPVVDKWFSQLAAAYVASRIASMERAQVEGIRKAIQEHDQRDLERAIGNPQAGEPSGIPGTEIRDSLPGLPRPGGDRRVVRPPK